MTAATAAKRPPAAAPPPGEGSRARILEAAALEFAERGLEGARIDAIARRAGVNKALLYYYFPGKQELYHSLLLGHIRALLQAVAEVEPDPDDPGATLEAIAEAISHTIADVPMRVTFFLREVAGAWPNLTDEEIPLMRAIAEPIERAVQHGIQRGDFRPVPPFFVHMLILGALTTFALSAPARSRGARVLSDPGISPSQSDFTRFLTDIVRRGLTLPAADPGTTGDLVR
jgi:AcrR family transcriptional regulator